MTRYLTRMIFTMLVLANMTLLIIPGAGIIVGVTNQHVIQPMIQWARDPGPQYVEDPRCCR